MQKRATLGKRSENTPMYRCLILMFVILLNSQFALAGSNVPSMYRFVAEENRVPAKLFFAMVLAESRKRIENPYSPDGLPWPWVLNHRGKPYFFSTRDEAHKHIEKLIRKKDYNFDVGLGQVNWKWHRQRFSSSWEALDPYVNLTVSATVLREQFERPVCNDWAIAVGCYHRPGQRELDKKIAQRYAKRVIEIWQRM